MYVYLYLYIINLKYYMFDIYIFIYYKYYHKNNVPYRLSSQWLCGNSCTWAYDVWLHITGINEYIYIYIYI